MDKWNLFQKFLVTESSQVSILDFVINSALLIVIMIILSFTYSHCGKSLSGRKAFAANFLLIAFTTMLIISIVKSSLALSLGLVGALSIVRFRAAIKEPEELAYLFLCIAIGLGFGANQRLVTVVAFGIVLVILWVRFFLSKKSERQNLFLNIAADDPSAIDLNAIKTSVNKILPAARLTRYDETESSIEASWWIEVKKTEQLQQLQRELAGLSKSVRISFIDNNTY
jgi:magnesium-transporting ATPase (P-type)